MLVTFNQKTLFKKVKVSGELGQLQQLLSSQIAFPQSISMTAQLSMLITF